MKQKSVLILVSAAWLVLGCGGGGQYTRVLDRAEEQNQNWDSITGIDSIRMAAAYMDRHGSANEQVRAHYLLGCAYRDAGEAPNALEAYHEAAERADTTSADCDYGLLMRVHAQAAMLFKDQQLPEEMLDELKAQRRYAQLAGDDRSAIIAIERSADAYRMLDMKDSAVNIQLRASDLYEQYSYHEAAAIALGPIIDDLVERGDTAKARRCILRYESAESIFKDGEILPRKALYYFFKGKYCLAVGKPDSAEVYFRKLIKPGRNASQLEAGYRGLYLLYKMRWVADSMAKYADLLYEQTIPAQAEKHKENMQLMQRLYNYTRLQHEAKRTAERSEQQKILLIVMACVSVILLMAFMRSRGTVLGESPSSAPQENSERTVPRELSTPEAMALWRKAQEAGYVNDNYQPLISRTQSALLADAMAEHLGIRGKWKIFEAFWHRNNMRSDYNQALSQRQTLAFQDQLKKLTGANRSPYA